MLSLRILADKTDALRRTVCAQNDFEESLRHRDSVCPYRLVFLPIEYRATNDVYIPIFLRPFATVLLNIIPVAAIQSIMLRAYI